MQISTINNIRTVNINLGKMYIQSRFENKMQCVLGFKMCMGVCNLIVKKLGNVTQWDNERVGSNDILINKNRIDFQTCIRAA